MQRQSDDGLYRTERANGKANGHKPRQGDLVERALPADLDAEIGLLGSIILNIDCIDDVAQIVKSPREFSDSRTGHGPHGIIYKHLLAMHEENKRFDDTLFVKRLKKSNDFESVGGAAYIAKITNAVSNAAHAIYYAGIVHDAAISRAIIYAATEVLNDAFDDLKTPSTILAEADSAFSEISIGSLSGGDAITTEDAGTQSLIALDERMNGIIHGITTGIHGIDSVKRMCNGELVILAARPAMGKSAMAGNVAVHVAKHSHDEATLFVSLEMRATELMDRMLCAEAKVDFARMQRGSINVEDRALIGDAFQRLSPLPILIDDKPGKTVTQIAAQARKIKRKRGLKLVVIDYLQLIEPDDHRDPRQEQVAKISRRLKLMARSLNVPVICLAQVNRQAENTKDCKPRLSHLRESGAIEADADTVLFLHRPAYYTRTEPRDGSAEVGEVLVAKARNSPTRLFEMNWFGQWQRWDNKAPDHQEASNPGWQPYNDNPEPPPQPGQQPAQQAPQQF